MDEFNLDVPKMGHFILFKNSGSWLGNAIVREQENAVAKAVEYAKASPYPSVDTVDTDVYAS